MIYELLQNICKSSSYLFCLLLIISLIREYEYVCILIGPDEPNRTCISIDNTSALYEVDYDNYESYASLPLNTLKPPLCAQITPGVVSISSSEGVGYTVTGDKFFKRMGDAPFFFIVNICPYYMFPLPGGLCSLKVDWSC